MLSHNTDKGGLWAYDYDQKLLGESHSIDYWRTTTSTVGVGTANRGITVRFWNNARAKNKYNYVKDIAYGNPNRQFKDGTSMADGISKQISTSEYADLVSMFKDGVKRRLKTINRK